MPPSSLPSRFVAATVSLSLFAAACGPSITRTGYASNTPANDRPCQVAIKRGGDFPEVTDVVGSVEVGDSGFSTDCSEETMIAALRKEACAAGANIVDILEEKRPDLWSTCYRAKARLLRTQAAASAPPDDPRFAETNVQARTKLDSDRQSAMIWGAIGAGVLGGLIASILIVTTNKR